MPTGMPIPPTAMTQTSYKPFPISFFALSFPYFPSIPIPAVVSFPFELNFLLTFFLLKIVGGVITEKCCLLEGKIQRLSAMVSVSD
jgi:hypothetical protein